MGKKDDLPRNVKVVCNECDGQGGFDCPSCEGCGVIFLGKKPAEMSREVCRDCRGVGIIKCPECEGTGLMDILY